jgi:hypothetical protein
MKSDNSELLKNLTLASVLIVLLYAAFVHVMPLSVQENRRNDRIRQEAQEWAENLTVGRKFDSLPEGASVSPHYENQWHRQFNVHGNAFRKFRVTLDRDNQIISINRNPYP